METRDPMCEAMRSELLDELARGGDPSRAGAWTAHAAECAACARFASRAPAIVRAFADLPRASAPRELEGLVVASLEAGRRQERAVAALRSLGRVAPPVELDQAVDGELGPGARVAAGLEDSGRRGAPRVLERLVAEEIADPAKAIVRRFVGSLRRLRAPRGLELRLARELAAAPARAVHAGSRPRRVVGWTLIAAAIAALLTTPLVLMDQPAKNPELPFQVEYVDSLGTLDPIASGWLDAASGGASRTRGI